LHVVTIASMTPDTEAAVSVDASGNVQWGDKLVVNPWDEYAITEAVLLKEAHSGQVTVMAVGAEAQAEALKHGLAIGCDQAIRVWDPALVGADSLAYARAAAAAIRKLGDADLVIFGKEMSDSASDQHVFQTARKLGWTMIGFVAKIEAIDFAARTIRVRRMTDQGSEVVSGRLPAVISVLKDINEPKYPTFIGIRKAAKAEIPVWSLADLGLSAAAVAPRTAISGHRELPRREGSAEIIEGASAQEQAAKLVARLLEEKIL